MPRLKIRAKASSMRLMFGLLALLASLAYGFVLISDRADWIAQRRPSGFVSDLGSEASHVFDASQEATMGSLALTIDSRADWDIPTATLDRGGKRIVTIVSGELEFVKHSGAVSILLGGVQAITIRPANGGLSGAANSYGPVDAPPVADRGFRIPVPEGNSCLRKVCRISVRVRGAYLRIYRVAVSNEDSISDVGEFR